MHRKSGWRNWKPFDLFRRNKPVRRTSFPTLERLVYSSPKFWQKTR
jgi:hypothetical protein